MLHQYFFFHIRSQDNLVKHTIDEAQGLWDSLYKIYKLEGSIPEIEVSITRKISEGMSDLTFIFLGELRNSNQTAIAQQLFFNDVLIFIITLTTEKGFETDTPERNWEQQMDIEITTQDLENVLGLATVIHTKSQNITDVLMRVRINVPFAKEQTVNYCTFGFCQLYQFGNKNKFLLVSEPERSQNISCKKFIENHLPYILTLNLLIKKSYDIFLNSKTQLNEIKNQIKQHNQNLETLKQENDSIMLAIRRDHVEELYQEASNINLQIKGLADDFNNNIMKTNAAIKNIEIIKDDIFSRDLKKSEKYSNEISSWLAKGTNLFKEISSGYETYNHEITRLLEKLEKRKDGQIESEEKPRIYTTLEDKDDAITIDASPYKSMRDEYKIREEIKPGILDSIPLEWCSSYSIMESTPKLSMEIFRNLVTGKERFTGFLITQFDKDKLINKFKIEKISSYQISTKQIEGHLPPILSKISHLINEFLSSSYHSIILLEGIDYLVKHNDYDRVLKFCNNIKDTVVLNDSILIFCLNDSAFVKNELEVLKENTIDITNLEISIDDLY
jgi:uncharacterized protein YciU (UPF0263 family)